MSAPQAPQGTTPSGQAGQQIPAEVQTALDNLASGVPCSLDIEIDVCRWRIDGDGISGWSVSLATDPEMNVTELAFASLAAIQGPAPWLSSVGLDLASGLISSKCFLPADIASEEACRLVAAMTANFEGAVEFYGDHVRLGHEFVVRRHQWIVKTVDLSLMGIRDNLQAPGTEQLVQLVESMVNACLPPQLISKALSKAGIKQLDLYQALEVQYQCAKMIDIFDVFSSSHFPDHPDLLAWGRRRAEIITQVRPLMQEVTSAWFACPPPRRRVQIGAAWAEVAPGALNASDEVESQREDDVNIPETSSASTMTFNDEIPRR